MPFCYGEWWPGISYILISVMAKPWTLMSWETPADRVLQWNSSVTLAATWRARAESCLGVYQSSSVSHPYLKVLNDSGYRKDRVLREDCGWQFCFFVPVKQSALNIVNLEKDLTPSVDRCGTGEWNPVRNNDHFTPQQVSALGTRLFSLLSLLWWEYIPKFICR